MILRGSSGELNMALMVQLQELCDEKGIQLQYIILPNKELVYSEYMPSYTIANSKRRTETFVEYVEQHSRPADIRYIRFPERRRVSGAERSACCEKAHWRCNTSPVSGCSPWDQTPPGIASAFFLPDHSPVWRKPGGPGISHHTRSVREE